METHIYSLHVLEQHKYSDGTVVEDEERVLLLQVEQPFLNDIREAFYAHTEKLRAAMKAQQSIELMMSKIIRVEYVGDVDNV
jgi:hypothetical protein